MFLQLIKLQNMKLNYEPRINSRINNENFDCREHINI